MQTKTKRIIGTVVLLGCQLLIFILLLDLYKKAGAGLYIILLIIFVFGFCLSWKIFFKVFYKQEKQDDKKHRSKLFKS